MTINAEPVTIFNELRTRVTRFINCELTFSEMEVKRLERDIASLAKVDSSGALELRSHLAAASRDFDACDAYFEKALQQSSTDVLDTVVRYMLLMRSTARGEQFIQTFHRFHDLLRNNPRAIHSVSSMLEGFGCFKTAATFRAEGIRMKVVEEGNVSILQHVSAMSDKEEREFFDPIQFSQAFLRSRGVVSDAVEVTPLDFEDGKSSILYEFWVNRSVDDVAELEWDLFGELASENFSAHRSRKIVFALTPRAIVHADHC